MASENQASYTKIGLTVLVGIVAIIFTLIYLGGMRGRGEETIAETYYDKGVSGLSVGSVVNLRGVKVGEVREISFIGCKYDVGAMDAARIYIKFAISHDAIGIRGDKDADMSLEASRESMRKSVENGLRATVTSSGITGLSRIELDFYPPDKASKVENISWKPELPFVPPQIGLMDSFSESATKVMNQINKMDLNSAWSNVAVSVESLASATTSMKVMMETRQDDVEKILDNLSEAISSIKDFAAELKRNPSLLLRERKGRVLKETAQ